jgi:hypothetical protein
MDIQLATERLFLLEERVTMDEIQLRAMDKRTQAFGGGLGSLLQRPKPEEIQLVNRQRRLEPFWHVSASARYVYDRNRDYTINASASDVLSVTVNGSDYDPISSTGTRSFRIPVLEHCREEYHKDAYTDGLTGAPVPDAQMVLSGPRSEVADPASLSADGSIAVPPEQRASYVVRQTLSDMVRPVQADKVIEEVITLEATDLYYRPIWAFEFAWTTRDNRPGVIEIDSITGQLRQGKTLTGQIGVKLTRDLLFDIGADTASMLIPGGGIAIKLAKAAIDSSRK